MILCGVLMIIGLMVTAAGAILPMAGVSIPLAITQPSGNQMTVFPDGTAGSPTPITQANAYAQGIEFEVYSSSGAPTVTYSVNGGSQQSMSVSLLQNDIYEAVATANLTAGYQVPSGSITFSYNGATDTVYYTIQQAPSSVVVMIDAECNGTPVSAILSATGYMAYGAQYSGVTINGLHTPLTVSLNNGVYIINGKWNGENATSGTITISGSSPMTVTLDFPVVNTPTPPGNATPPLNFTTGILNVTATVNNATASGNEVTFNIGNSTVYNAPAQLTLSPGQYVITAFYGTQNQTGTATIVAGYMTNATFAFTGSSAAPSLINVVTVGGLLITIVGLFGMIFTAVAGGRRK
jgi:hypothetical protein